MNRVDVERHLVYRLSHIVFLITRWRMFESHRGPFRDPRYLTPVWPPREPGENRYPWWLHEFRAKHTTWVNRSLTTADAVRHGMDLCIERCLHRWVFRHRYRKHKAARLIQRAWREWYHTVGLFRAARKHWYPAWGDKTPQDTFTTDPEWFKKWLQSGPRPAPALSSSPATSAASQ